MKTRRITISIDEHVTDEQAIESLLSVIRCGKISKGANGQDHYCWHTAFNYTSKNSSKEIIVTTRLKYGSKNDRFVIYVTQKN